MADLVTLWSLETLLLEKIYPIDILLCRNDSKTSKLVFDYLALVEDTFARFTESGGEMELSDTEQTLLKAYPVVGPLIGLSQATIRKYISEVWVERSAFSKHIRVDLSEYHHRYREF